MRGAWPALFALALLGGCEPHVPDDAEKRVLGGDAEKGRALVRAVGCGACHLIPGIIGARGTVGPTLDEFAGRNFIGGVVANRPTNLIVWVRDAPALAPDTAMPPMPLTEEEARHVAAYLYTLD